MRSPSRVGATSGIPIIVGVGLAFVLRTVTFLDALSSATGGLPFVLPKFAAPIRRVSARHLSAAKLTIYVIPTPAGKPGLEKCHRRGQAAFFYHWSQVSGEISSSPAPVCRST